MSPRGISVSGRAPVPEDGRGGEARADAGHAQVDVRGLHLRQVVQPGRHAPDRPPKVDQPRAADGRRQHLPPVRYGCKFGTRVVLASMDAHSLTLA